MRARERAAAARRRPVFPIHVLGTANGKAFLERLESRRDQVLDRAVVAAASRIVAAVRRDGDRALLAAVRRFEPVNGGAGTPPRRVADLRLKPSARDREGLDVAPEFRAAFAAAHSAVGAYARRQKPRDFVSGSAATSPPSGGGPLVRERWIALRRVALYVPGGRASYPSTLLMTAVPAQVAGVEQIVVATPLAAWLQSPELRHVVARLGIEEVWGMGGAQAIAALALGTESIERVDKIVGPGNAWVTAAKDLVRHEVGIDGVAGPSEVVVVADEGERADWIAADLVAQAEHDPRASAILVTTSRELARAVASEVGAALERLRDAGLDSDAANRSLERFGGALVVRDMERALAVVERLAPEHLQLVGPAAEALQNRIRSSGATFVGSRAPEVFGDYVAGPSHVLPTCGTARWASGLGVHDFLRRTHVIQYSVRASRVAARHAAVWAHAEGLPGHAASAQLRGLVRAEEPVS